jgi:hypothetical protein
VSIDLFAKVEEVDDIKVEAIQLRLKVEKLVSSLSTLRKEYIGPGLAISVVKLVYGVLSR